MTNPEHDEGFEAYLKRRSVLTNALDDRLEPPAALDEIVLQSAREAIKGQAASGATQQTVRAPRWAMPVALAATILLCLSVVLNISLNTNRPPPDLQRSTAARANVNPGATADGRGDGRADGRTNNDGERRESVSGDVPSREVVLTEAKVAGSPALREPVVADSAQGAPPPAPTRLASAGGPEAAGEPAVPSDFASAAPPASTAAPAPSAFRSSAVPRASAAASAPSAFASAAPPASAAASAPSAFASAAPPTSAAAPAPSAFASAMPRASAAAPVPSAGALATPSTVASAAPPASAGVPAPSALDSAAGSVAGSVVVRNPSTYAESAQPASDRERLLVAKSATGKVAPLAKRADASSPPGSATATAGAANAPTPSDAAPHPADPNVWLKQIAALRAAGETDRADTEMRRFRTVFPGYAASPAPPAASEPPK